MATRSMLVAASWAASLVGLMLLLLPGLGVGLLTLALGDYRLAFVRLIGAGLVIAVSLGWSIKDFVES